MKILYIVSLLLLAIPAQSRVLEDMGYGGIGGGDLYRAINWIRNVANPAHTPTPSDWTQESRVGDTLFIDGEVQEIQWSMLNTGEYKGVKRIVINSYGGNVAGALEFAKVIRKQGLTTVVPAGGVCMSACTLIFQAGVKRMAHKSAIFMYHAPRSGRIGISDFNLLCDKNGDEYCEEKKEDFIEDAPNRAHLFFSEYQKYDLAPRLVEFYLTMPDEKDEVWLEDGNWLKKADLVFANDLNDPRLDRLISPEVEPLESINEYNVVTDWFDINVGWTTDRSVKAENPYAHP